jgi:membrane-bound lytic murein transglycosylase A
MPGSHRRTPPATFRSLAAVAALAAVLAGCAPREEVSDDEARFTPASFADLPGWAGDDHAAALAAFAISCPRLTRMPPGPLGGAADWKRVCDAAASVDPSSPQAARAYFERHFEPLQVSAADGDVEGLITGYYEPELNGSLERSGLYTVPLYRRPPDLVAVDLGRFDEELKGKRIAGRVIGGRLVPYHDRAGIDRGVLKGRDLELVWVDSAADAFFLHIQGSGRVRLRDGTIVRVGYAGTNGHPYSSIGRELIDRGEVPREEMSMQAIRKWLAAHPADGAKLMRTNKSYVFFRELEGPGPLGALGAPLTPGRSLAIDRRRFPLGMPVWLATVLPGDAAQPFRRLMVAQDTGGAIRGSVRADIFWGPGSEAAARAGAMQSPGRYWFLRPRPAAAN